MCQTWTMLCQFSIFYHIPVNYRCFINFWSVINVFKFRQIIVSIMFQPIFVIWTTFDQAWFFYQRISYTFSGDVMPIFDQLSIFIEFRPIIVFPSYLSYLPILCQFSNTHQFCGKFRLLSINCRISTYNWYLVKFRLIKRFLSN